MVTITRRAAAGAAVLLWVGGLAALGRRTHKPAAVNSKLIEAATHLNPGPAYYLVTRDGKQIGFASSTADTIATGVEFDDYMIIERRTDSTKRMAVQSTTQVSRSLAVSHLDMASDTGAGWTHETADLGHDSTFTFRLLYPTVSSSTLPGDRMVLAPDVVPLVIGMGGPPPSVGTEVQYRIVDAASARVTPVTFRVAAESLFVVSDSAVFDMTAHHWRSAMSDTLRAWKIVPQGLMLTGAPSLVAWIDGQGRVVDADADIVGAGALHFHRTCYELAYRNWPGRRFR
jgi:hypothetical protein